MYKIGFIGAGNMGTAMIRAIVKSDLAEVRLYDINQSKYDAFEVIGAKTCDTMKKVVEESDYIVLTIKPQYYKEVIAKIKDILSLNQVIITVAPGFDLQELGKLLGSNIPIIRTMPNTPALVGEGVTAYCYEEHFVTKEQVEGFLALFNTFSQSFLVPEALMEAVVATSGSSPAYGYMFIEAMADAAVSFGMPRDMAYQMAALSIKGACEMILETGIHPGALKDQVTSPGGTTICAVTKLEETGLRHSVISGMTACYEKAVAMNKH